MKSLGQPWRVKRWENMSCRYYCCTSLHLCSYKAIVCHCPHTSPSPPASVGNLRASWVLLSSSISSFCSLI